MKEYHMPFNIWTKVAHEICESPYYDGWTINLYLWREYGFSQTNPNILENPGVEHNGVVHFVYEVTNPKLLTKFLLEWS